MTVSVQKRKGYREGRVCAAAVWWFNLTFFFPLPSSSFISLLQTFSHTSLSSAQHFWGRKKERKKVWVKQEKQGEPKWRWRYKTRPISKCDRSRHLSVQHIFNPSSSHNHMTRLVMHRLCRIHTQKVPVIFHRLDAEGQVTLLKFSHKTSVRFGHKNSKVILKKTWVTCSYSCLLKKRFRNRLVMLVFQHDVNFGMKVLCVCPSTRCSPPI